MQKSKMQFKIQNLILFTFFSILFFGVAGAAFAQTPPPAGGFGIEVKNPLTLAPTGNFLLIWTLIIKPFLLSILGSIVAIMFLWAAILLVTAGGDPAKAEKAKKIIIWTVIGVALITAAEGLIALVKWLVPPIT